MKPRTKRLSPAAVAVLGSMEVDGKFATITTGQLDRKRKYVRGTAAQRFWAYVNKNGPVHPTLNTACWLWTAARLRRPDGTPGYGVFGSRFGKHRQQQYAHRFSAALAGMKVTSQVFVLHHCDTPACVRPEHLFLGTARDNMNDMIAKGRSRSTGLRGEAHVMAKLNNVQVQAVRRRRAEGATCRVVAAEFGISAAQVCLISTGKKWGHLAWAESQEVPK